MIRYHEHSSPMPWHQDRTLHFAAASDHKRATGAGSEAIHQGLHAGDQGLAILVSPYDRRASHRYPMAMIIFVRVSVPGVTEIDICHEDICSGNCTPAQGWHVDELAWPVEQQIDSITMYHPSWEHLIVNQGLLFNSHCVSHHVCTVPIISFGHCCQQRNAVLWWIMWIWTDLAFFVIVRGSC